MSLEHYDAFYRPLVGDDTTAQGLHDMLTTRINSGANDSIASYYLLETGLIDALTQAAQMLLPPEPSPEELLRSRKDIVNANIGLGAIMGAIRGVGEMYERKAKVPQHETGVRQNLERTLRYAYGIAFADPWTGVINFDAIRHGRNPNGRWTEWNMRLRNKLHLFGGDPPFTFRKMLVATRDNEGQLDIQPRYPRRRPATPERGCPAAKPRVRLEGKSTSALWALTRMTGDIALREIYPGQFDIIPSSK